VANELLFLSTWGLYDFSRGLLYCRGSTNRSGASKVGIFSLNAASFLRYLKRVAWRGGVQWIVWSISLPRKTCIAEALFLGGSWASCLYWEMHSRYTDWRQSHICFYSPKIL